MKEIEWYSVQAKIADVSPTEKNYKIRNALGRERLAQSLKLFGLAGNVVCNWTGKMGDVTRLMLVDGNSRLEQALEKQKKRIWVSVPDRKLTPKEFLEMSAMFDMAKAGDVDSERIQGDLGKTKDFYDRWNLIVPKALLDKLGTAQMKNYKKEKQDKKANSKALKITDDKNLNDTVMIQLLFTQHEAADFREMETKLAARFKTKSTMQTVLATFKHSIKK